MYYVTTELKKNKELRKTILDNIKFKEFSFSKKTKFYNKENANPLILGSAYEIVLQVEKLKKEKNPYELRNLKFNRGINLIMSIDQSIMTKKVLKNVKYWIQKYNKSMYILIKYIKGKKIKAKKIAEAILFLNFISYFREVKNIFYFKPKYTKEDIYEVATFIKGIKKKLLKKIFKGEKSVSFNYLLSKGYLAGEIDILTSKTIYDIKTTSYPTFTKDMIIQLILYYFLSKEKQKQGAIVFSKFNHIEYINIQKIFKKKGLKKIKRILKKNYNFT